MSVLPGGDGLDRRYDDSEAVSPGISSPRGTILSLQHLLGRLRWEREGKFCIHTLQRKTLSSLEVMENARLQDLTLISLNLGTSDWCSWGVGDGSAAFCAKTNRAILKEFAGLVMHRY